MACELCGGTGIIRQPVSVDFVTTLDSAYHPHDPPPVELRFKDLPCLECAKQVPIYELGSVHQVRRVRLMSNRDVADVAADACKAMARQIGEKLWEDGFLRVTKRIEDDDFGDCVMNLGLSVAVTSEDGTKRWEDEVARREREFADRVIKRAMVGILAWGSDYGHTEAPKDLVMECLRDALAKERELQC